MAALGTPACPADRADGRGADGDNISAEEWPYPVTATRALIPTIFSGMAFGTSDQSPDKFRPKIERARHSDGIRSNRSKTAAAGHAPRRSDSSWHEALASCNQLQKQASGVRRQRTNESWGLSQGGSGAWDVRHGGVWICN